MISTLVIIPTYNERQNLEGIVNRVLLSVPEAHVLVVDDNSPDGTGTLASELALGDSRVQVLHRAVKDGLGGAYRAGFGCTVGIGNLEVIWSPKFRCRHPAAGTTRRAWGRPAPGGG